MRLNEKLKKLCGARNWNQADLIRAVGDVSKSTMSNWWNGDTRPDLESALRIARALGVALDFLADDGLDAQPLKAELPEDERSILKLYRALGLSEYEALRRLAGEKAETGKVRPVEQMHAVSDQDLSEAAQRQDREKKRHLGFELEADAEGSDVKSGPFPRRRK